MPDDVLTIHLTVEADPTISETRLAADTRELQNHLARLRIGGVEAVVSEPAPTHAKADAVTLNQLIVSLAGSGAVVAALKVIQEWLGQRQKRKVTIKVGDNEVTIEGDWDDQALKRVDTLARHHLKK